MRIARRLLIPAVVFVVLSSAGVAPASASSAPPGWSQFGYSATHTGYNPHETTLSTSNVSALRTKWSRSLGLGNSIEGSAAAYLGRIFVQTVDGRLSAFRASDGHAIWRVSVGTSSGATSPALWNGWVIAAANGSGSTVIGAVVAAYDQTNGSRRWKTTLATGQGSLATPVVSGDSVFLSTGADLYRLSARTGAVVWRTTVTQTPDRSSVWGPVAVSADGGTVVAASVDGVVYNLSAASGRIRWRIDAGGGIYRGGPAIAGGVVYVAEGPTGAEGPDFDMVAIRLSDGGVLWRADAGDDIHATPAVAYGLVYIGAIDSGFRALDARTGALRWSIEPLPEVWSSAAVANGVVYEATESTFFALNARTGRMLFSTVIGAGFANMSSPAVWGGRVYLGSGEGVVRAFTLP